jgi:UDP-2,3-diacylglucosamine hydrolase
LRSLAPSDKPWLVSPGFAAEESMDGPVYFISDAHLGSSADPRDDEPRLARLVPFFRHVAASRASHLYILGDLFDFWFEYEHVMPWRHFRVLREIRRVTESGVPVSFLGGNHDWWAGRVFEEAAGMAVHRESFAVRHQGKSLFLAHGDGLASSSDSGYLLLKKILRHRWTIRMLRAVHPDFAYAFGHRFSRFSRDHLTDRDFRIDAPLARAVDEILARGHDAFLMGHLHARHRELRPSGGTLFILGEWMTIFSALRLQEGVFAWEDWSDGTCREVGDPDRTVLGGHLDD